MNQGAYIEFCLFIYIKAYTTNNLLRLGNKKFALNGYTFLKTRFLTFKMPQDGTAEKQLSLNKAF